MEAPRSFGEIAREVVAAPGGGSLQWEGLMLASLFQPVHCVERGAAIGDEALLRATGTDGEAVRARGLFASLDAERRVRLDWICRALHLRSYAVVAPGDRQLFLNVHPLAVVEDADGGRALAELVRFYGLSPDRVHLEVVESECGDESALAEAAAAYRDRGFTITMDHFGRGRSNFDRIAALRPKVVKMDGAVLRSALGNRQARRVLPSLVAMLKDTGAKVAVKDIVNAHHALAAIEAGADYLQGVHLGAPTRVPRDEPVTRGLIHSARRIAFA
jgi:EAL domain-containing protein (putative c-di-GMP-specific phosphodiesterase class I)